MPVIQHTEELPPPDFQRHQNNLSYYITAITMALPAVMLGLQISGWIFFFPGAMQGHADFRQLYTAAYMVRTGHASELFDYAAQKHFQDTLVSPEQIALPFIRPAYQALLFVPLSYFSYRVSYLLFLILNLGLLTISFRILHPGLSNLYLVWNRFPEALFLAFLPTGAALMQGQDSILLLFLFSMSWLLLKRGSPLLAGICIGSALFKFQISIPVAALFLFWRRWRLFAGFCATSSALALLSMFLTGLAQARLYLISLFSIGAGLQAVGSELHYPVPVKMMPNLHGLVYGLAQSHNSSFTITLVTIFLSAALVLWVAIAGSESSHQDQLMLAIVSAIVVSYYIFAHDLVILEIPILIALHRTTFALRCGEWRPKLMSANSLLLFSAPAIMVFSPSHFYLICLTMITFVWLSLQLRSRGTGGPERNR